MSLSKTVKINLVNNEYQVRFPNTGEQMDIDILKLQLTDNKYDQLKYSFTPSFMKNATRVDVVATFTIMIPDLKKHLNVKSLFLLEEDQMQVLVDEYENTYLPFYEEWMATLNKPKEEKADKKK